MLVVQVQTGWWLQHRWVNVCLHNYSFKGSWQYRGHWDRSEIDRFGWIYHFGVWLDNCSFPLSRDNAGSMDWLNNTARGGAANSGAPSGKNQDGLSSRPVAVILSLSRRRKTSNSVTWQLSSAAVSFCGGCLYWLSVEIAAWWSFNVCDVRPSITLKLSLASRLVICRTLAHAFCGFCRVLTLRSQADSLRVIAVRICLTRASAYSVRPARTRWTIKKRDILFLTITLANLNRFL